MGGFVEAVASQEEKEAAKAAAALDTERSNKCKRAEMTRLSLRLKVWSGLSTVEFPSLTKAVQRLLVCHATSCATGTGVCGASQNALGMERGQKLMTICANSRQAKAYDFDVSFAIVERFFDCSPVCSKQPAAKPSL
jgi:hypothetical protein